MCPQLLNFLGFNSANIQYILMKAKILSNLHQCRPFVISRDTVSACPSCYTTASVFMIEATYLDVHVVNFIEIRQEYGCISLHLAHLFGTLRYVIIFLLAQPEIICWRYDYEQDLLAQIHNDKA